MRFDTVVKGGRVVLPGQGVISADVGVQGGRVAALVRPSEPLDAARVISADGKYVFPGVVDAHVHLGFVSLEEEWRTESRSAALGGVTTFVPFLLQSTSYLDTFQKDVDMGQRESVIDFSFHFSAAAETHIREIDTYVNSFGVPSHKLYMSFRGDEGAYLGVAGTDDGFLYEFLEKLGSHPEGVAVIHPENIEVVWRLRKRLQESGAEGLLAWHLSRPPFVEAEATHRCVYFGGLTKCPIYLVHMSSREAVEMALRMRAMGHRLFLETCPHYLTHTHDTPIGSLGKVNPPLRTADDMEYLWEAIANGTIDTVQTDHNARRRDKKQGSIWKASAGFPGLATLLPVMLSEGFHKRKLSLTRIAEIICSNPARIFGLTPRKGAVQVGADADLVIVDLDLERNVQPAMLGSYSDYSLYEGQTLKGWPVLTMVRGEVVMKDGQVVGKHGYGRFHRRVAR